MRLRLVGLSAVLGLCMLGYLVIGARGDWGFVLAFRGQKLLALLLVGVAIAWSTLIFQTLTGNRILTPAIMGFDALYMLGLGLLIWVLGVPAYLAIPPQVMMLGNVALLCLGALGLFGLVLRANGRDLMRLLLTGVVLSVLIRSLTGFLMRVIDPNEYAVLQGAAFARFSNVDPDLLTIAGGITAICGIAIWRMRHRLDVIGLGPDLALSLGEPGPRSRRAVLLLVSLLVAVSTALVGPVTFLGLLVTNLTYLLFPTHRHAVLLPATGLVAGIVLIGGQGLLEHVMGLTTPLSVVIEAVGGLSFLVLLLRMLR
ncbi:MAG: iron chelate uptake ABC transporter family permease subunit [Marinibacterium sp.]|nr:iron chelate uptake ABC transporter family permease subunit [Marinibacterium sp.]